jgi:uncharacterized C2H2 Zn-finger protein
MKLPMNPSPGIDDIQTKCTQCGQQFRGKIAWRRHMSVYHTNCSRFRCDDCGKVLSSRQNLNEHTNIHTGVMPYVCNFEGCQMRFRQGSQLSVHKRIHKAIVVYRNTFVEGEALKLTECMKDSSSLDVAPPMQVTIPGWVKLPPITTEKLAVCLPTIQLS